MMHPQPSRGDINIVYLGIGSNVGEEEDNCRRALASISRLPSTENLTASSLYKTEPVGEKNQPWFINCVARIETGLSPDELLTALLEIEKEMGRTRREKWGPRTIDLDILFFGTRAVSTPSLTIPHPEAHRRRFVLLPLLEIDPSFVHPGLNRPCADLLAELGQGQECIRI